MCESSAPASEKLPAYDRDSEAAITSGADCVIPVIAALGATFVPVMVWESVPGRPPSSDAVNVTTNVPSSSGVKVKDAPDPLAYGLPFFVTCQLRLRVELSTAAKLVAEPVNGSGVPSGIVAGSVTIRAVGATTVTVRVEDVGAVGQGPSSAVGVGVWGGSSGTAGARRCRGQLLRR